MRSSPSSSEAAAPASALPLVSLVHAEPTPFQKATHTLTASTAKPLPYSGMTSSTAAPLTGYTGRYTQPDPIGLLAAALSEPSSNVFSYAEDRPLRFTDRWGLFTLGDSCDCLTMRGPNGRGALFASTAAAWRMIVPRISDVVLRRCVAKSCDVGTVYCRQDCS